MEKPVRRSFNNQDRREVLRESGVKGGEKMVSDLGSMQGLEKFGAREVQGSSGGMGFGADMGLGSGAEMGLGSGAEMGLGSGAEKGLGPGAEIGVGMELDGGQEHEGGEFVLPGKRRGKQGKGARGWKGGSPDQGGSGYVSNEEEGGVSPLRASANRFSVFSSFSIDSFGNSLGSLATWA